MYYTIGQRRGLEIGGTKDKLFVVGKDLNKIFYMLPKEKIINIYILIAPF